MTSKQVREAVNRREKDPMYEATTSRPRFEVLEQQVCEVTARQLGVDPQHVQPETRLLEDLNCDSLEVVELFLTLEDHFNVSLPDRTDDPVYKSVFTRSPFRMRDLTELVHLRWKTGNRPRNLLGPPKTDREVAADGFTQLGGRMAASETTRPLLQPIGANEAGLSLYRRRTDGMVCVELPAASVRIGRDDPTAMADERPAHVAELSSFLMDVEPVSTTAFARFLNSVGVENAPTLREWFVLDDSDRRCEHMPVRFVDGQWEPVHGTEEWPMILVSWHGANAYALWAHGKDWARYAEDAGDHLPTEAQWEYAARGAEPRRYPWGDREPTGADAVFARHERGRTYTLQELPLMAVQTHLGLSPFGLRHMAGNVWHWCRDWYAPDFYGASAAEAPEPVNTQPTGVRSERGGSWIGPAELLRSSYRRARPPSARGRCLGFRCVSAASTAP